MSEWADGYVTEVNYTSGYYPELSPLRTRWALLAAGVEAPALDTEAPVVCELGMGQGVSMALHAAAQPGRWWGTDINPAHACHAAQLGQASGADVRVMNDAFVEFAQRSDLPEFDMIAMHGIWSWISHANRGVLVNFVQRRLKAGGVLYLSYNTLPGWADRLPLRQWLCAYVDNMTPPADGLVARIGKALAAAEAFLQSNPMAFRSGSAAEQLKQLKVQNPNYLAHEYFNRDWQPMFFADVARWLAPARLGFAASAHLLDNPALPTLTGTLRDWVMRVQDVEQKEALRDFAVNQLFRRDLWVKGGQPLTLARNARLMAEQTVVLVQPAQAVALKAALPNGMELTLQESLYSPVIEALANHVPQTVGQLQKQLADRLSAEQLREVVMVLMGTGALAPAQSQAIVKQQRAACHRLNVALVQRALQGGGLEHMVSPVTGGGVVANRFEKLFLAARASGKQTPGECAAWVWNVLLVNNERLVQAGKPLTTADEHLSLLTEWATTFADARLDLLQALGVSLEEATPAKR